MTIEAQAKGRVFLEERIVRTYCDRFTDTAKLELNLERELIPDFERHIPDFCGGQSLVTNGYGVITRRKLQDGKLAVIASRCLPPYALTDILNQDIGIGHYGVVLIYNDASERGRHQGSIIDEHLLEQISALRVAGHDDCNHQAPRREEMSHPRFARVASHCFSACYLGCREYSSLLTLRMALGVSILP